jgi:hypothetical protein
MKKSEFKIFCNLFLNKNLIVLIGYNNIFNVRFSFFLIQLCSLDIY